MSSPADAVPVPGELRDLQQSILVKINWPADLGRPSFAPSDHVPIHPKLQHFYSVKVYRIEMVKSAHQEPGKPIAYDPLPVPLDTQTAREYLPATTTDGITSGTMIASGNWGAATSVLVTVKLAARRIWVHGPALAPNESLEFWAVPGQHWATAERAYPEYGSVPLDRTAIPLGKVEFQAERR